MQPCLNDPTETEYRSFYLQWEFTSMTSIRFNSDALSHHNNTISACHYWTWKLNHQINILFLFSPSWCVCTGLTHPTILSFGTLQILLPALTNLANVLSFLFPFICDSSSSKSNLLQMKSLQTSFLNPNFPGYQRKAYISEFPSSVLPGSSSYGFTWWTNFSNSLNLTTLPLSLTQYSSLWPIFPTSSPKAFPPLPTLEVA